MGAVIPAPSAESVMDARTTTTLPSPAGRVTGVDAFAHVLPADVSVVGFDDLDISAIVTPKLTTVAQDIPTKATIAVDLLLAAIEQQRRPTAPTVLDVAIVPRASTAARVVA